MKKNGGIWKVKNETGEHKYILVSTEFEITCGYRSISVHFIRLTDHYYHA